MIKYFGAFLLVLFLANSAQATAFVDKPSPAINEKGVCEEHAYNSLVSFAEFNDGVVVEGSFRLIDNDKRVWNPSHYSWYEIDMHIDGEFRTAREMTQLYRPKRECL